MPDLVPTGLDVAAAVLTADELRTARSVLIQDARRRHRPFTDAAKVDFLVLLGTGMPIKAICAALDLSSTTVYQHRREQPQFAADWAVALELRFSDLADQLADVARTGPRDAMSTVNAGKAVLQAVDPNFAKVKKPAGIQGALSNKPTIRVTIGQPMPD